MSWRRCTEVGIGPLHTLRDHCRLFLESVLNISHSNTSSSLEEKKGLTALQVQISSILWDIFHVLSILDRTYFSTDELFLWTLPRWVKLSTPSSGWPQSITRDCLDFRGPTFIDFVFSLFTHKFILFWLPASSASGTVSSAKSSLVFAVWLAGRYHKIDVLWHKVMLISWLLILHTVWKLGILLFQTAEIHYLLIKKLLIIFWKRGKNEKIKFMKFPSEGTYSSQGRNPDCWWFHI